MKTSFPLKFRFVALLVIATCATPTAHAALLHFNINYGNDAPGVTETFDIDSAQTGVSSPASVANGYSADEYEDFVITNDSLGYSVLLLGSPTGSNFFGTADNDYDAANNYSFPYTNTDTSLYSGTGHQLIAVAGQTVTGLDDALIVITAAVSPGSTVPEPSTVLLMGIGVALIGGRIRRRGIQTRSAIA